MSTEGDGVSIIIPTRNRWDSLAQVLPAYLSQNCVSEVVVVDDDSNDLPPEGFVENRHRNSKLRCLRLPKHLGTPSARNAGIRATRGELVLFGEDDVLPEPGCVEILRNSYNYLREKETAKVGAVTPMLTRPSGYGQFKGKGLAGYGRIHPLSGDLSFDFSAQLAPLTEVPFTHACCLIPRRTFSDIGLFNEDFGGNYFREESEFQFRLRKNGYGIFYEPRAIMHHFALGKGGAHPDMPWWTREYHLLRNQAIFLRTVFGSDGARYLPFYAAARFLSVLRVFVTSPG